MRQNNLFSTRKAVFFRNVAQIIYIFVKFVYYFLGALQLLMFVRAILSWIMPDDDNMLTTFVESVTEPVIIPVRMLLERFEFIRNMPIDISFFVAFMLLTVVQMLLPQVRI